MNENKEKIEIDMNKFENARYQEILDSGKYAELKILIGTEKEEFDGVKGILPCVRLELNGAQSETISVLYSTLKMFVKHLEGEYPVECWISELTQGTKELGAWEVPVEDKKSKKKKE